MELVVQAREAMERHKEEVHRKTELIRSPDFQAFELAALASFRHHARQVERQLWQKQSKLEQAVAHQRTVVQAARRRLSLVEKLKERRVEEYRLEVERELEAVASESHLAGFARSLTENSANSPLR